MAKPLSLHILCFHNISFVWERAEVYVLTRLFGNFFPCYALPLSQADHASTETLMLFLWYFWLDPKVPKKSRKYMAKLRTGHSLTPPYFLAGALLLLRSNSNRSNKLLPVNKHLSLFITLYIHFLSKKSGKRFLSFECHFRHSFAWFSHPDESGRELTFWQGFLVTFFRKKSYINMYLHWRTTHEP